MTTAGHRKYINPLNAELNPIRHLLALVGGRHIVHVSRVRVNTQCTVTHDTTFEYYVNQIHKQF